MKLLLKNISTYIKVSRQRIATLGLLSFAYFFVFSVDVAHGELSLIGGIILGTLKFSAQFLILVTAILSILSFAAFLAGVLFDMSLGWTVLDAGRILSNNGSLMVGIKEIWTLFRDISNILIIGMFVFIAISTILGIAKYANKQAVVSLLTVALLINFSFFFTQVVIDLSNWTAVQAFKSITPEDTLPRFTVATTVDTDNNIIKSEGTYSISSSIMSAVRIQDWKNMLGVFLVNSFVSPIMNILFVIMTFILLAVTALLFLRMAFLLIGRWVILVILMMTSSLAFAAMLIPSLNKYWVYWRDGLIYNAVVAPVLLVMLYAVALISDKILTTFPNTLGTYKASMKDLGTQFFTGDAWWSEIGISLTGSILVILLLYAAIRVATMLADNAASSAGGLGKAINGILGGIQGYATAGVGHATFGTIGWAGRETVGRGFQAMSAYADRQAQSATSNSYSRRLWSGVQSGLGSIAGQSFDMRQSQLAKDIFGKGKMGVNANVGKAITDGFQKIADAKDKKNKELDAALDKRVQAEAEKELETKSRMNTIDQKAHEESIEATKALTNEVESMAEQQGELTKEMSENSTKWQEKGDTIKQEETILKKAKREKDDLTERLKNGGAGGAITNTEAAINQQEARIEKIRNDMERDRNDSNLSNNTEVIQDHIDNIALETSHLDDLKNLQRLDTLIPETESNISKAEGEIQGLTNIIRNNQNQLNKLRSDTASKEQEVVVSKRATTDIKQRLDGYDTELRSYSNRLSSMRELDAYPENYKEALQKLTDERQDKLNFLNSSSVTTKDERQKIQVEIDKIADKIVKLDKSKNLRDAAQNKLRNRVGMSKGERVSADINKKTMDAFNKVIEGLDKPKPDAPTASDTSTTTS